MSWIDVLFGPSPKVVEAQRRAATLRAKALASHALLDEVADNEINCERRDAAESISLSQSMRSIRPQSNPGAEGTR